MTQDKPNPFLRLLSDGLPKKAPATPEPGEKNISDSAEKGLTNPSTSVSLGAGVTEKPGFNLAEATKQFLTPEAMQLLKAGTPTVPQVNVLLDSGSTDLEPAGLDALAAIDTESLEPKDRPTSNINVEAAKFGQRLVLESSGSVRELCDRIDKLIEGNPTLVGPSLADLRNYVQQLMITLKSRPEFDGVVLDKDVRNVMIFIRKTREEALGLREVKVVKKVAKATNKEKKQKELSGFADAFQQLMSGGLKK